MSLRRLEALALDQLRTECARLAIENDTLRTRAERAEAEADAAREDAHDAYMQLIDTGAQIGITLDGHIGIIHEAAQHMDGQGHMQSALDAAMATTLEATA